MSQRFSAEILPSQAESLVIGTSSRTKYIQSADVNSAVHSNRGATMTDLIDGMRQYLPLNLTTVTLLAGFNDHRSNWREFIHDFTAIISYKFAPSTIIAPKIKCEILQLYDEGKGYKLKICKNGKEKDGFRASPIQQSDGER